MVGQTYLYYVGGPDLRLESKWFDHGRPFGKKRYEYVYVGAKLLGSTTLYLDFHYDWSEAPTDTRALSFAGSSARWNVSRWDAAMWTAMVTQHKRVRVGHTGVVWKLVLRNPEPFQPLCLLKLGMRGEYLTDKR